MMQSRLEAEQFEIVGWRSLRQAPSLVDSLTELMQAIVPDRLCLAQLDVMEYVTERLIKQVCREVEQAQIDCLKSHALTKAQAKESVRDMQTRLIVSLFWFN